MKVKLREVNGARYLLLKKEIRLILGIDKEVDITIKDNNIIVSPINKDEVK